MPGRLPIKDAVSAGGVVWRRETDGGLMVVVCGSRKQGLWVLPKGTPNRGEPLEQTALREVEEETGLAVELGEKVGQIEYWFVTGGYRWHKYVHHWLMAPVGGDVARHDQEFEDVEWMPIDEAMILLRYDDERRILAQAAGLLGVAA